MRFLAALLTVPALVAAACSDGEDSAEAAEGTAAMEPADAGGTGDFSAISPVVEEFLEENGLDGAGLVVVEAEQGIVHEEYWDDFGPDRVSLVASSSKMLSAGILLALADDGALDLDAPVADQLGWEGDSAITPAQLISNSSGLVGLLPEPTYAPYLCQFLSTGTLLDCGQTVFGTADDDADVVPPDTEFRYGGAQWQVAGAVAEAASGSSWAELLEQTYVEPCGVDSLGFNNHFTQLPSDNPFAYPPGFDGDPGVLQPSDNPNIEGGAYISAPDYAELLLMHLRGGMCGDERVLSEEALDTMHADRIGAVYDGSAGAGRDAADVDEANGYGMGWWIDRESGVISDPGAYGAYPWLDLDAGYGAYLVIEGTSSQGGDLAGEIEDLVADAVGAG
jgi:CubicO group peptidase (beta-lactamase class C family)